MHLKEQLGILVIILEICKGIGWCSGLHIGALEGEIAILTCNKCKENARSWSELQNSGFTVEWSVNTSSGFLKLTQTEKVFFEFNTLRLLGVTLNNTGVYKCTLRNETDIVASEQLELEVYNGKCYNKNYEYLRSSFVDQSTNLICPEMELFSSTKHRVTWVKDCDQIITSKKNMHIDRTQKIHAGHYTCINSVEYDGKEYNISKTINLVVKDSPESMDPKMTFPIGMVAIEVEIGKETAINCTAILYKNDPFVTLYWQKNNSFVSMCEDNNHVCSEEGTIEHIEKQSHNSYRRISTLIFKNVQEEHLNMKYDCILSSTMKGGNGSIVLIKKKVISTDISHSSFSSGIIMVVVLMITIVTVIVICVLLKVDIVLVYRAVTGKDETIGDFKEYDAYVTYDSSTSSSAEEERTFALEILPKVLEEQLGYQLCIYQRDVLPGGAENRKTFGYLQCKTWTVPDPWRGSKDWTDAINAFHKANMWTGVYWALPVILLLLPGVQVTFYTFQETEGFLTGMQPSGYIALAGDQFIMQCASLNQSVIYNDSESYQNKVAWFRHYQNGGQAQPVGNGQENIILKGNFLWFPKLETVHSGVYSCQIRDEKIYLTLAVIQKDKTHCQDYAHSTVDLLSGSGDSITCPAMTCYSASGHLPVRWYKNGKLVKLNKNRPTLELENEKLVLKTVYKRDAANYTCDFNYSENDTLWIVRRMLTVRVFGKETKIPPSILNFNGVETIEAELGKPLTLECRVNFGFERNSTPTIKWLVNSNDNSTDISLELEESRIVEDDGNGKTIIHTAYFSKVTERHLIATFTCFAQNFQGNTTGVLRLKKKSPVNGPFLTYVLCGIILTVIFIFGGSAYIYIHWIEIVLLYRNYFPYDETIGDGKEYDAFISHANHSSSEDILESEEGGGVTEEMFVLKLLPEFLEQQCGYKLCFLERDVLPGGAYTEDIVASIKRSRRVIYVLSPRYISSPCIFELQTGINQLLVDDQFKLILIKFRPLPEMDTLPHIVKKALNILPAMKWNGSKSNHSDSTFWKNVRYHMPVKKTKISNGDPGL